MSEGFATSLIPAADANAYVRRAYEQTRRDRRDVNGRDFSSWSDDVRGCDRDDGDDLSDNLMRKAIYS